MAYPTYITEAVVCGSTDSYSADRFFLLFTREAGMVHAYAKSVREERSKQRYALQECSHIRATLVRGKSGWRIAGVEPIANLYARAQTRESRALLRNLLLLLRRLMQGEMVHERVFDTMLAACASADTQDPVQLELVATIRILHALGYIAPDAAYARFLHDGPVLSDSDTITAEEIVVCRRAIETALRESQL
jgi:recombinational DNA repair protein (RecF pathway)